MDYVAGDYKLENLGKINVLLGKNGSGKSTMMRTLEGGIQGENLGNKRYVTPERGGVLTYQAGIEQQMFNDINWMSNARRVNQFSQFKEQSATQFRRLELLVHREAEKASKVARFQPYVDRLNSLLDNIELRRVDPTFKLYLKQSGDELPPTAISSGESELIALGIEMLMFTKERQPGKDNVLLLDEPDVHLHPDLQERLGQFLQAIVDEGDLTVIIATHSTALLGGLSDDPGARVAFMKPGDMQLAFTPVTDIYRAVLPVFGAHPLSNVFNKSPILIVEGEDDERVWQQAVRSSTGQLQVYPVSCEGVSAINEYEKEVDTIVSAVYDHGIAYSVRDGDGITQDISDEGVVRRFRLKCRTAENLMLADEVFAKLGLADIDFRARIDDWLAKYPDHSKFREMKAFKDGGFNRKDAKLKEIRIILAGQILDTNKPWEILVGQALAELRPVSAGQTSAPDSIETYLGSKLVTALFH